MLPGDPQSVGSVIRLMEKELFLEQQLQVASYFSIIVHHQDRAFAGDNVTDGPLFFFRRRAYRGDLAADIAHQLFQQGRIFRHFFENVLSCKVQGAFLQLHPEGSALADGAGIGEETFMALYEMFGQVQANTETGLAWDMFFLYLVEFLEQPLAGVFTDAAAAVCDSYMDVFFRFTYAKAHRALLRGEFYGVRQQVKQHDLYLFPVGIYFQLGVIAAKGIADLPGFCLLAEAEVSLPAQVMEIKPGYFQPVGFALRFPEQ